MNITRTPNYVFTADPLSAADMLRIQELKDCVKRSNKLATKNEKQRVSVKPRLGKNSPFAHLYAGTNHMPQTIKMEHGSRFDVYIHDRRD